MKIAHVLTYLSEDGAYGGPVAVALAQCQELSRRGHTVTLFAGWDGKASVATTDFEVVLGRAKPLVSKSGFSTFVSPDLWKILRRRLDEFDVVHVHLARDLVTAPIAATVRRSKARLVVQTHGMIRPDGRLLARLFDAIFIRRLLRRSVATLYLTRKEERDLRVVSSECESSLIHLTNGVSVSEQSVFRNLTASPEVLFMSRLSSRKQVLHFVEAARRLIEKGFRGHFSVVGPDGGDLPALLQALEQDWNLANRVIYEGSLPHASAIARLARADLLVLPSFDEPFPMVILEALSQATPVLVTRSCGIAQTVEGRGGLVTDGSVDELVLGIDQMCHLETWRDQSVQALRVVRESFSIRGVGDSLERIYSSGDFSVLPVLSQGVVAPPTSTEEALWNVPRLQPFQTQRVQ